MPRGSFSSPNGCSDLVLKCLKSVLRAVSSRIAAGGRVHYIVGNSTFYGVLVPTERGLQELLKEQYSALEESRADLVALYFVADPQLAALGLVPAEHQDEIVLAEYEAYVRNALVQLRRVREGTQLEEDHMRNRQAIVHWLMAHTTAIEMRTRDAKTYYVVVDVQAFRDGVARLLAEVQRIKSEGDYEAAKMLFETYGVHFDAALRDEIVARVDRLKLPSYTGFVMPKLQAVYDKDGSITDVEISYPCDLMSQMLEFSAARRDRIARL